MCHFREMSIKFSQITDIFFIHLQFFTLKLRITDLGLLNSKITEVSVFFTDGWQHCMIEDKDSVLHTLFRLHILNEK